jgi:DNA polymerase III subunit alpha
MSMVHLHTHSEFSLLDGLNRIERMVCAVRDLGQHSLALTDHGVMYGVIDFYKTCLAHKIKPIIGCELYFTDKSRHQKESREDAVNYHLILLAKNHQGYQNLCKLVSLAHIEGFYYKPRLDWELLEQHHDGLIAMSACIKGHVPSLLLSDRAEEARQVAIRYKALFNDDYYLEVQNHGLPEELKANPLLAQLGKELNIPLVATQDAHYPCRSDAYAHDLLLCVQTLSDYDDPNRIRFSNDEFYIKSQAEMQELFKEYPDAISNTELIAEKCNIEFDFDQYHLPVYQNETVKTVAERKEYLQELCYSALPGRYGPEPSREVLDRLEYELEVINNMHFVDYFLVVQDFVNEAKRRNIYVGPGRGSAAGSIVSYLLNITGIDPLQYHLYFERFLNPARISMPDIDIDFEDERRDEVIAYVREKYGAYKVAQVATFGKMEARGVIRDVARAFKYDQSWVNRLSKTIPFGRSLEEAYTLSPEFKQIIDENEDNRRLYDTALDIEGQTRNFSVHAAGVVIGDTELWNYVPLQLDKNKHLVVQYDKDTVEKMGLLKIDFLGLRNLTVIRECIQLINEQHQKVIDVEKIPLNDPEVFQLYKKAATKGVFQVESRGMRQIFKELDPSDIEDVIAVIALYRPGPMEFIKTFIRNKAHPEEIVYEHPVLEPILKNTYGICVYQEQVMSIAQVMGGFSLGEADLLRKAMGKKKKEIMEELKGDFIQRSQVQGYTLEAAKSMFEKLEFFSGYGFNRAHAAAYGLISYQTAWFKVNYPVEYMTALLNSVKDDEKKLSEYIAECLQMKIEVLPPDINLSQIHFTIEGKAIRFALLAIKNAGKIALELIVENRQQHGPFRHYTDFAKRMSSGKVNKKVIESLIKAGAFDVLEPDRSFLLQHIDGNCEPEVSLFGALDPSPTPTTGKPSKIDHHQHMHYEKEALGFYFSMHPFAPYLETYPDFSCPPIEELQEEIPEHETLIEVFALIDSIRQPRKKNGASNGNTVAIVTISDMTSSMEFVAFGKGAENLLQCKDQETAVLLSIRIRKEEDRVRASLADIKRMITREEMIREQSAHWRLELCLDLDVLGSDRLVQIKETIQKYAGSNSIQLLMKKTPWVIRAGTPLQVEKNQQLLLELEAIVGSQLIGWKRCLS